MGKGYKGKTIKNDLLMCHLYISVDTLVVESIRQHSHGTINLMLTGALSRGSHCHRPNNTLAL